MRKLRKILAFVLCLVMLATSMLSEGMLSLFETIRASAIAGHEQKYDDARVELDFNKGWKFSFSDDSASHLKGFDDSAWEDVDLPHDFSISQGFSATGTEAESGNIPGGTGWYRKWFNLYDYYTGDDVTINFDGVYQHAYVYVNGQYVGENHYGYNSFSFEISDYLLYSNTSLNLIAVKVVNDFPSSRWYSGSGIYRDVKLTIADPVHVSLYGPQVTTPDVENGGGTAKAVVSVHNHTAITKKITVETTILDSDHNPVSDTVSSPLLTIQAETEYMVTLEPEADSPELWTLDNPTLYKLKTVVKNESGNIIDEYHTTFGYRYISWDADKGFCFNGEYIKLKGVCLHHDQGALGAIQEYESIYRQVAILKDMGCNAIRTAHNSTSRVLIDICNELGMLVVEEFFDGWDVSKNANIHDFSEYFNKTISSENKLIGAKGQKWFEFVVEQTVLRDRHDPCVIAWDVGNELCNVDDVNATGNYKSIVESIVAITDRLDPSRALTQGNNASHLDPNVLVDSYMDVIGGNYNPYYWSIIMNDSTDPRSSKPFVATESVSSNNSRGIYDTMSKYDFQCTSYDTYAVDWGNEAAEAWYYVATNDFFSGEFVWTGFDYIGETTPWMEYNGPNPNFVPNSSYFGIVDTAGFAKDSYYLYRSLWNDKSTTLHLVPGSWNEDSLYLNNGYVNVAVYSNAKKIELLLNGSVIATATSTVTTTPAGYKYRTWTESISDSSNCSIGSFFTGEGADFYPQFSVKYAEGTLSVKAYDESGAEITDTVGSKKSVSGTATQIAVNTWQDKDTFVADGTDYIYVEFEARDAEGNFMNDYNGTVSFKVDDTSARYAKIVGVDNGNPATTNKFQQPDALISDAEAEIEMFNGRAVAILKTTEEEGTIKLTAIASDGTTTFSTEGITVTSESEAGVELTDEFEEVIVQIEDEYEPTLFDEYEMVNHHVGELEAPVDDGGAATLKMFALDLADPSVSEGSIKNGNYIINSNNVVMSGVLYNGWAIDTDNSLTNPEWASEGSAYKYNSFYTSTDNIYTFTHIGGNKYYIQNASTGEYLTRNTWNLMLGTDPYAFSVEANDDGSVLIYTDTGDVTYYVSQSWGPYEFKDNRANSTALWLYSDPNSEGGATSLETVDIYLADSTVSAGSVKDGEYVIFNNDWLISNSVLWDYVVYGNEDIYSKVDAASGSAYPYERFDTVDTTVFTFTHQGDNKYYIQNKSNGKYLKMGKWYLVYDSAPQAISVTAKSDGSIVMNLDDIYMIHYVYTTGEKIGTHYFYSESINNVLPSPAENQNTVMWLYSPKPKASSGGKYTELKALYDALNEGVEYDYSSYTRTSYEKLLDALENGVAVYKNSSSTKAEITAATAAIRAAIDALGLDIKKISGTLFKYGYSNENGTADYSDGGTLMNKVAVKQMKTAILADPNLVSQIKEIIGYNDPNMNWVEGRADAVLEEVAEMYAKIYTLQFTGRAYNGAPDANAASNFKYISSYTNIPTTLWNVWTKDNTHGAEDIYLNGEPVHDGASVQGLASATLDDGVVTSHTAYTSALPYANDGPDPADGSAPLYDIETYTYGIENGTMYKEVQLKPLAGISVYFPDLFSRESLDADGNATTSTTGEFSKYYWDTEFPMFISTDKYGVNTYHFDSKDTRYLVQSSFNDAEHTVDMELNEVGSWSANGSNSGSGFFPFNYKQGATSYTGENAIYHYGFTFEHNFYIPKGGKHLNGEDVIFSFSGDDDVLVYIDGVLVLDNGGLHGARAATINFTNCSINYQYAIDVTDGLLKGDEYETTYSYNAYIENPDSVNYNADTIAAINKLHEVITDGEVHTLNFFYLERGASDSNCKISFNLSETSEEVRIIDQNLTLDYGLTVEYDITENNKISDAAIDNNVKIEYLGICSVNAEYAPTYTFEKPQILIPFEDDVTYTIEGMKYGVCTVDNKGNVTYTPTTMNMTKSENFYVVAKITGDPTYAGEVVYYQVEKTTFVPATAIYYEDTFDTITYKNGKVPSNYDNTTTEYGMWKELGNQPTTLKQTADLTDSEANPYGYEVGYTSFATYSGGSIHYTDVSTKNNPSSKYSGGSGAAWPTVDFTFTGTGFDLISITDCTTGAFSVMVKDDENKTVRSTVVDTFYGYDYGRLYAEDDGAFTLDSTKTALYRTENGTCTSEPRYYDENGAITDVPHYYDEDENVVETETDNPAYSYAYGWVVASPDSTETLYQIPVIKVTDLAYGSYTVTITPTFTSMFGHSSKDANGNPYYRVYLDAIKIYSPAGVDDEIADADVKKAYSTDDELYPNYLEIKNMLIGADSLSETSTQGIIFIDGIAALDNDIETYKTAGPNNELYLAKDQAVAFEIWATSVPTDVQIGVKLACGKPDFTVSYASKTTDLEIRTATDNYYSFNTILPNDGKLTWRQVTGSDGNKYYTTGTVVIQNTGATDSVLSITNLKWTFSQIGGKGYFRIPTPIVDEDVTLTATTQTQATAYSLMRMRTAALDVEQVEQPEVVKDEQGNSIITVKFTTSKDVDSIVVTDKNGNPVDPSKYVCEASEIEGEDTVEWTVTFTENKGGDYIYQLSGAYSNGYTDGSKAVTVSFTVENPPEEEPDIPEDNPTDKPEENPEDNPTDEPNGEPDDTDNDDSDYDIFDIIVYVFKEVVKFIKFVIGLLGIKF